MERVLHWVDALVGCAGAPSVPMPCNDELECDRAVFARQRQGPRIVILFQSFPLKPHGQLPTKADLEDAAGRFVPRSGVVLLCPARTGSAEQLSQWELERFCHV